MCACNLTWVTNDYELCSSNGAKWIIVCPKWPDKRRTKIFFLHNYMIKFKYWILSLWVWAMCAHKTKSHWNYMQSNTFLNCYVLCAFFSFYERKYAVFLKLFAHQREYQALMNWRWRRLWHRAVLVQTLFRVTIVMTSPHTGNKNSPVMLVFFFYW